MPERIAKVEEVNKDNISYIKSCLSSNKGLLLASFLDKNIGETHLLKSVRVSGGKFLSILSSENLEAIVFPEGEGPPSISYDYRSNINESYVFVIQKSPLIEGRFLYSDNESIIRETQSLNSRILYLPQESDVMESIPKAFDWVAENIDKYGKSLISGTLNRRWENNSASKNRIVKLDDLHVIDIVQRMTSSFLQVYSQRSRPQEGWHRRIKGKIKK